MKSIVAFALITLAGQTARAVEINVVMTEPMMKQTLEIKLDSKSCLPVDRKVLGSSNEICAIDLSELKIPRGGSIVDTVDEGDQIYSRLRNDNYTLEVKANENFTVQAGEALVASGKGSIKVIYIGPNFFGPK